MTFQEAWEPARNKLLVITGTHTLNASTSDSVEITEVILDKLE